MIANKHITKIVAIIMAIAVCLCLCAMVFSKQFVSALGGTGVTMEYETELFDTNEIISLNILMDAGDWSEMLANATAEQYYQCDVEINGKTFYRVGIRPKGNTSLSAIASDPDNDRYSFKLEFDQYIEGQTCFGLDKLVLNNNYADATNMKEALTYDMFQYIGADASLYNYAKISVNGEYWGVYLALEAVEDSFLLRNYGTEDGELYKPDSMSMGGDNKGDVGGGDRNMGNAAPPTWDGNNTFDPSQSGGEMPDNIDPSQFGNMTPPTNSNTTVETDKNAETAQEDAANPTTGRFESEQEDTENPSTERFESDAKPNMGGRGGAGMGGNGSNLNYTDDDLDSYSTIWDCEVTNTSKKGHKRVVAALKNISQGTDLENYMDIDNLLKYAAAHIITVNADSLSGSMAHNYYLYENDGKLNILPWDYNLILGGMGGMGDNNNATATINDAIDDAFSSTDFFDTLLADEEYHAQYYAYLQQLVDEYLLGDGFQTFYNRTRSLIDELVKTDPNALYTYEEYETALETFCEVVELRGQSINGQLDGTIPSTESEQKNSDTLIDASHIDLSVMGSMNMGGSRDNFGNFGNGGDRGDGDSWNPPDDWTDNEATRTGATAQNPAPPDSSGEMAENFDPSQFGGQAQGSPPSGDENAGNRGQSPGDFNMGNAPGMSASGSSQPSMGTIVIYGGCFVFLVAALVFVVFYKRKPRKR